MEENVEKYCMEMMSVYGGCYEIHSDLKVVAIYKGEIQEVDILSFGEAIEALREFELEEA